MPWGLLKGIPQTGHQRRNCPQETCLEGPLGQHIHMTGFFSYQEGCYLQPLCDSSSILNGVELESVKVLKYRLEHRRGAALGRKWDKTHLSTEGCCEAHCRLQWFFFFWFFFLRFLLLEVVAYAVIPGLYRQRKEELCEFEANQGYIVRSCL